MSDETERASLHQSCAIARVGKRRQVGSEPDDTGDDEHAATHEKKSCEDGAGSTRQGREGRPPRPSAWPERDEEKQGRLYNHVPLAPAAPPPAIARHDPARRL